MTDLQFSMDDKTVSTEELDNTIKEMQKNRAEYDARKKLSDEAYHRFNDSKLKVLLLLEKVGKTKYVVDNLGTVSVVNKLKVQTPKTNSEKEQFFKWLEQMEGKDGLLAYTNINYSTLNSLYNRYVEQSAEAGEDFKGIPGIGEPIAEKEIRFRKG